MRKNLKWVVLLFLAVGISVTSGGIRSYWKNKRQFKQLEKELAELRDSNKVLEQELRRIKNDPRIAEQIARSELGLMKPGEIEYRFVVPRSTGPSK